MRTKEPTLRITKWLRRVQTAGSRIPFEAECTACANAQFKIKYDKRKDYGCHAPPGPPDLQHYVSFLQHEFEKHLEFAHTDEYAAKIKEQAQD